MERSGKMTDTLTVTIHKPYMRVNRSYIEYVVEMEIHVNEKLQKHEYTSYTDVEEAVAEADSHKETILNGRAALDAWLVAHGGEE